MQTASESPTSPPWSGFAFLAAAAGGSLVGIAILFHDAPFPDAVGTFTSSGAYVMWVLLTVGQVGLLAALALALQPTLRELRPPKRSMLLWPVVLGVAFFAVLVLLTVAGRRLGGALGDGFENPLPYHVAKLGGIAVLGSLVAAVATVGIGLVQVHLLDVGDAKPLVSAANIAKFLRMRLLLHRLLVIEAAILGSAILALAALRGAIEAVPGLEFPQQLLIGYGLAGSAALASVYAPAYGTVLGVGRRLLEAATPVPSPEDPGWSDALDKRTRLEGVLRIDSSIATNAQAAAAILTPLVGSVLGVIVNIE